MFKFIGVGVVLFVYALSCTNANMEGGPGLWYVFSLENCGNDIANVVLNVTVMKHKLNRTHDVFDADLDVFDTIGDGNDGILIDICKHTDGGCKQVQVVSDDNIGNFAEKYAKENMEAAFTLAGIDPPRFPVGVGTYHVDNFFFDRCEMPENAVYGEFTAHAYVVRDTQRIGCVRAHVEFRNEDDNECEYD